MGLSVSIIIPNLNSPIIDRVLAAIRAQEFDLPYEVEILVVGLDEPRLVRTDKLTRLISTQVPVPPAVARNLGVREAKGNILCFLDADCIPDRRWLSSLLRRYDDENVKIVGGGVAFPKSNYWAIADNIATFYPYLHTSPAGTREQLPSLNLSLRREVWEMVGPFDERYPRPAGEDADWTVRARLAGYTLHFEPRAVVMHYSPRSTIRELWNHAVAFGLYSVKVDKRYWEILGIPFLLRHWLFILLAAPAMALWVTGQIFRNRHLWRYLPMFPAIYLAKLGWCWGAFKRLRGKAVWHSNI
ncbi:MAG: glycosyltransferase [Candidatus Bathyarchaeia archaeon]